MSDLPDDLPLDQYLADESDARDAERTRAFLNTTSGRRGVMAGTRAWLRGEDIAAVPYAVEQGLRELLARIDAASDPQRPRDSEHASGGAVGGQSSWLRRRVMPRAVSRPIWYGMSAVAVVATMIVIAVSEGVWRPRGRYIALPAAVYTTGRGQRANITLSDGSTVALNVASRLEVPADYAQGNHTLHLTGEALFAVTHHDGTPFTVVAGSTVARVLGTSFVVRHYATDSIATVAVRDGKVVVQSIVLTAAQQVNVHRSGVTSVELAQPARFAFATGVLSLEGMLLPQAIVELGRWYNADIRIGSPALVTRHVKGEFATGSLADLAAILEWTYDIRVVRDGQILTLYTR